MLPKTLSEKAQLTHWDQDNMATILQTTFSNVSSWMEIAAFWFKFSWNLFPIMVKPSDAYICVTRPQWVNKKIAKNRTLQFWPSPYLCEVSDVETSSWKVQSGCNKNSDKQRVLMHRHQGWNVRHGLCHIYMRYLYIYELFIAFVCFVVCSLL